MKVETKKRIEDFIESLSLPSSVAKVLFETVEDCQLFYTDFYSRNRYIIDDLLDYREYKIERSQKTLDLFIEECYNNKRVREAFQSTFYQSFTENDMRLIGQAIADRRTSLKQLFMDFKKNPNKNILKNVL